MRKASPPYGMIGLELGGRPRLGILSMMKADEKSSSKLLGNLRERSFSILDLTYSGLTCGPKLLTCY